MSEQSENNTKSRSMDLSDLSFSNEETNPVKDSNQVKLEAGNGERVQEFKVDVPKLSRNFSTASHRFGSVDHQRSNDTGGSGALQAMVRRAFSMRRPSSLADGYWRIHNTGDEDNGRRVSHGETVIDEEQASVPSDRKRKGTKFIRACKRFFGL